MGKGEAEMTNMNKDDRRLIAAAPDLLELVKDMRGMLNLDRCLHSTTGWKLNKRIEQAISLAEKGDN